MENILQEEIDKKREKEKRIVKLMIEIYYKHHGEVHNAREESKTLIEYVEKRIDSCPFVETKTYCNNCKVHCYISFTNPLESLKFLKLLYFILSQKYKCYYKNTQ